MHLVTIRLYAEDTDVYVSASVGTFYSLKKRKEQKMGRILGLDLGTNSIGWAVVDVNNTNEYALKYQGVRIFQEGVNSEKGIESSKAAERTGYRSARRLKFRRRLRKIKTLEMLIKYKMCPLSQEELEKWREDKKRYPESAEFRNWLLTKEPSNDTDQCYNPYYLRSRAVKERISLYETGRALYHIAQRRGFKSNRLEAVKDEDSLLERYIAEIQNIIEGTTLIKEVYSELDKFLNDTETDNIKVKNLFNKLKRYNKYLKSSENPDFEEEKNKIITILNKRENLGPVKKNIRQLSEDIVNSGYEYLGEYFYYLYSQNRKIRNQYTDREEHYLKEFYKICEVQKFSDEQIEDFQKAIFFQRPLKSQKGLVGKCVFEKNKPRCPISHPIFEKYRMLCFLNNVKIKTPYDSELRDLTNDERAKCIPLFYRKSKANFNFEDICKQLIPRKATHAYFKERVASEKEYLFNYHPKTAVSGCPTSASLKNIFGEDWEYSLYNAYSNRLMVNGEKSVDDVIHDIWHVLFSFEDEEHLEKWCMEKFKQSADNAKRFSKIILKQGYASLSLKAIKKIIPHLEAGYKYSHAVYFANLDMVLGKLWKDEALKNKILNDIEKILSKQQNYQISIDIINSIIGNYRQNNNNLYSLPKFIADLKPNLTAIIEKKFGKDKWSGLTKQEREYYFNFVVDTFLKQAELKMGKGIFYQGIRIDEQIREYLKNTYNIDDFNLKKLYHPSDIEVYKKASQSADGKYYLGNPIIEGLKNPMVMRVMHQLRKVVNELIKQEIVDNNTRVHIELARELNDANMRAAISRWQNNLQKRRLEYREKIKELYYAECNKDIEPSETDVVKYQLWEEQNHICLYTGKTIGISQFIGDNPAYDIEHTIPRSLSFDNSRENLTLCDNHYNRDEKKNRIPHDLPNYSEIMQRIEPWKKTLDEINKNIQSAIRQSKNAQTKEQKDRAIQKKHELQLEFDYWKKKCSYFEMEDVPEGFKRSQLTDTRTITKYSRMYLQSVFDKVYTVQGKVVSDFRKIWGIQDKYENKSRINHIHHCIDAVTIACITRDNYDSLAHYYYQIESLENKKGEYKPSGFPKPWPAFTKDMIELDKKVLISHYTPDNLLIQTKKKLRKRGIIQKNEEGEIIYQRGNTVKGSLHKDKYYGAIKLNDEKLFVRRKPLDELKKTDIENIVDPIAKHIIEKSVQEKKIIFSTNPNTKNKIISPIWRNEEKKIPINKIRCSVIVKHPIPLKRHRDISEKEYKQNVYVVNDENYVMIIYPQKYILLNNLDAALLNKAFGNIDILKDDKAFINKVMQSNLPKDIKNKFWNISPEDDLKYIIKKGLSVFLLKQEDEIDHFLDKPIELLYSRYYTVEGIDDDGIKLYHNSDARTKTDVLKYMNDVINQYNVENNLRDKNGNIKTSKLTSPKGGDVIDRYKEFPYIKIKPNNFNALIESVHFKINPIGQVIKC